MIAQLRCCCQLQRALVDDAHSSNRCRRDSGCVCSGSRISQKEFETAEVVAQNLRTDDGGSSEGVANDAATRGTEVSRNSHRGMLKKMMTKMNRVD